MATQNPAKVKITVLKKLYHEDLVDAYLLPEKKASYPPCYRFNEGDVFIVDGFEMPAGFCPWAWADIHREIISVMFHAEFPNSKKPGCIIGTQPGFFVCYRVQMLMRFPQAAGFPDAPGTASIPRHHCRKGRCLHHSLHSWLPVHSAKRSRLRHGSAVPHL